MTLWSGRVESRLAAEVWEFLRADDAELLPYDCEGTLLHAHRLAAAGILSPDELAESERRLREIKDQGVALLLDSDEDVHSAIERLLGDTGRKIHAGRSRNDQVATALRLYLLDACTEAVEGVERLARELLERAAQELGTLMPGYTHLQRAQPVTLAHHLLAWVEMLDRDRQRFRFARAQAEPLPLGAGALAGSTLPLPAAPGQMTNSLDAVADRDFVLDYLSASAILFVHLSRIAEELVLWVSSEFGFASLDGKVATGSSMMPQKLNPDVAELVRGKAGAAIGRLTGLLATVKGLPLAYNRDLQEDKPPAFAARRETRSALAALTTLVGALTFDRERLTQAASDPLLLATDAAEELVRAGASFRDAHGSIASSVREGSYAPPSSAAESVARRLAPGPGGAAEALRALQERLFG